eukprot:scaffold149_cov315-Pinguiococcus_pyrenoidosus.AAC.11
MLPTPLSLRVALRTKHRSTEAPKRRSAEAQKGRRSGAQRSSAVALAHQGIQQHPEDPDGAPPDRHRRELVPEHHDSACDDDDSLERVPDGQRDRMHVGQREIHHLVVQVVQHAGHPELEAECLRPLVAGGLAEGVGQVCAALGDEHERREQEEAKDRDTGVEVGGRDAVAAQAHHDHLGPVGAHAEEDVAGHACEEGQPVEAKVSGHRDTNAADDGHQGGVHGPCKGLPKEHGAGHGAEERLHGLDDVREAHGSCAQGRHGGQLAEAVEGRDGRHHHLLRGRQAPERLASQAQQPAQQHVHGADAQLQPADQEALGEGVENALVADVVRHVQEVPQAEEDAHFGPLTKSLHCHCLGASSQLPVLPRDQPFRPGKSPLLLATGPEHSLGVGGRGRGRQGAADKGKGERGKGASGFAYFEERLTSLLPGNPVGRSRSHPISARAGRVAVNEFGRSLFSSGLPRYRGGAALTGRDLVGAPERKKP